MWDFTPARRESKGVWFCPPECGLPINTERTRTRQIISNLKVTSAGVALNIRLAEDAGLAHSPCGHQLRVNVSVPPRHDCFAFKLGKCVLSSVFWGWNNTESRHHPKDSRGQVSQFSCWRRLHVHAPLHKHANAGFTLYFVRTTKRKRTKRQAKAAAIHALCALCVIYNSTIVISTASYARRLWLWDIWSEEKKAPAHHRLLCRSRWDIYDIEWTNVSHRQLPGAQLFATQSVLYYCIGAVRAIKCMTCVWLGVKWSMLLLNEQCCMCSLSCFFRQKYGRSSCSKEVHVAELCMYVMYVQHPNRILSVTASLLYVW